MHVQYTIMSPYLISQLQSSTISIKSISKKIQGISLKILELKD